MVRPLRIEYPGAFYHVMNRGNAGEELFKNKRDRERFVECLETAGNRFSLRIHVYCLMSNHYHLLLETPDANLSRAVQWINVSFSVYFNRKRHRWGFMRSWFLRFFLSFLMGANHFYERIIVRRRVPLICLKFAPSLTHRNARSAFTTFVPDTAWMPYSNNTGDSGAVSPSNTT